LHKRPAQKSKIQIENFPNMENNLFIQSCHRLSSQCDSSEYTVLSCVLTSEPVDVVVPLHLLLCDLWPPSQPQQIQALISRGNPLSPTHCPWASYRERDMPWLNTVTEQPVEHETHTTRHALYSVHTTHVCKWMDDLC